MPALSVACAHLLNVEDDLIYQMILQRGPDVNFPDSAGRTPLHIAAKAGNHNAARILMQ